MIKKYTQTGNMFLKPNMSRKESDHQVFSQPPVRINVLCSIFIVGFKMEFTVK